MSNPYRVKKSENYTGECFAAEKNEDHDYDYTIWQIEPRKWIAVTANLSTAIELVNRLDSTGEYKFGVE